MSQSSKRNHRIEKTGKCLQSHGRQKGMGRLYRYMLTQRAYNRDGRREKDPDEVRCPFWSWYDDEASADDLIEFLKEAA